MDFHPTHPADQQRLDPAEIFAAGLAMHHIANTAYPIGHVTTLRPYRIPNSEIQEVASQAWKDVDRLGLYVHVPFCEARCGFCEYTVVDPAARASSEDLYFDLLLREFELVAASLGDRKANLVGFDIGGGTPSAVKTANIASTLEAARRHFHLPAGVGISIESTPKIAAAQPEKMRAYYQMGIRRISMGVQTIQPRLLAEFGRSNTSLAYNRAAAEAIRRAGFERFNIDVMYGFARQALSSLAATLEHVISLQPEYITLYRMRYKGTRIAGQAEQVSLDEVNAQARLAKELLQAAGYQATPGKNTFCRLPGQAGTSDYLTERVVRGTPYLGLGLGAQSLSPTTLSYNSGAADKMLRLYQQKIQAGQLPIQDLYHLSREAAMAKMISVSFYFGEIDLSSFHQKFGLALEEAFPQEVAFAKQEGYMQIIQRQSGEMSLGGRMVLRLTRRGESFYNGIVALFYAGAVKQHLLEMCSQKTLALQSA